MSKKRKRQPRPRDARDWRDMEHKVLVAEVVRWLRNAVLANGAARTQGGA